MKTVSNRQEKTFALLPSPQKREKAEKNQLQVPLSTTLYYFLYRHCIVVLTVGCGEKRRLLSAAIMCLPRSFAADAKACSKNGNLRRPFGFRRQQWWPHPPAHPSAALAQDTLRPSSCKPNQPLIRTKCRLTLVMACWNGLGHGRP